MLPQCFLRFLTTELQNTTVFGIGLDDCFIIMGAYIRSDSKMDPLERVRNTMLEVGTSITGKFKAGV